MGATIHDKLKDVVDSALRGTVCHAVTEATRALRSNGYFKNGQVYNPTTCPWGWLGAPLDPPLLTPNA